MILPGETILPGSVLPETFSSDCPTCQPGVSGPIFEGTIVPGDASTAPLTPMPAPPAEGEGEAAPGATEQSEPSPLQPTTMMIPTHPEPQAARQVHWVPNALK